MSGKEEIKNNLKTKMNLIQTKTPNKAKKIKPENELIAESPFTKFCKSDLSPIPSSPKRGNQQQSTSKIDPTKIVEFQTPPMYKKHEHSDFSPFLIHTAKKVIQKLDFGETKPNSVIVYIKSPTFKIEGSLCSFENDFIIGKDSFTETNSNNKKNDDEDDVGKLVSENPQKILYEFEKSKDFSKTMNKKDSIDNVGNNNKHTEKKPYVTPYEVKEEAPIRYEKHHRDISENPKKINFEEIKQTQLNNKTLYETPKQDSSSPKSDSKQINLDFLKNTYGTKKIICNCKKSRCLKLYCDCFRAGELCNKDCNCCSCANVVENTEERYSAMLALMERNPLAFKPKYEEEVEEKADESADKIRHSKGCNCKKSNCQKKYCECYQAGIKCSDLCKCENCKNSEFITTSLKKRKNSFSLVSNNNNFENSFSNGTYRTFEDNNSKALFGK